MIYLNYIKSKLYVLLGVILFCLVTSFTVKEEVRVIKNKFYTISVPKHWIPNQRGFDESSIEERSCSPYWMHYICWHTPIRCDKDVEHIIDLTINTYTSPDGAKMTIKDLQDFEKWFIANSKISSYKEKILTPNRKKVIIKRSSQEFGSNVGYYDTHLYVSAANAIHSVKITTRISEYNLPKTRKIIDEILDSFELRK